MVIRCQVCARVSICGWGEWSEGLQGNDFWGGGAPGPQWREDLLPFLLQRKGPVRGHETRVRVARGEGVQVPQPLQEGQRV